MARGRLSPQRSALVIATRLHITSPSSALLLHTPRATCSARPSFCSSESKESCQSTASCKREARWRDAWRSWRVPWGAGRGRTLALAARLALRRGRAAARDGRVHDDRSPGDSQARQYNRCHVKQGVKQVRVARERLRCRRAAVIDVDLEDAVAKDGPHGKDAHDGQDAQHKQHRSLCPRCRAFSWSPRGTCCLRDNGTNDHGSCQGTSGHGSFGDGERALHRQRVSAGAAAATCPLIRVGPPVRRALIHPT